jgi:cobyrinic acid a,c-diamide synthase
LIHDARQQPYISVAKDPAFGFYYQDDLDAFKSLGVKIKYFDTLKASELPKCDGLFIGGGFPEMQLESLSSNQSLLADIKLKIEQGLPTYASDHPSSTVDKLLRLSRLIRRHKP